MKRSLVFLLVILLVLFGFAMLATEVAAKDMSATLAPGATARIPIKLWCLDFGKPFPVAITGPVSRAPDAAVLALQAALASGATESDPYQTQLAIWRASDGTFHDVGGTGHVLAEQIYTDSLKLSLSSVPTNNLTAAISQGTVQVTIENFTPISDTTHSQLPPYSGTADLVVKNISNQSVTFVVLDGMVYQPAGGANAQTLISHQDTTKPSTLPTTGGDGTPNLPGGPLLLLELGGLLIIGGIFISLPLSDFLRARSNRKV